MEVLKTQFSTVIWHISDYLKVLSQTEGNLRYLPYNKNTKKILRYLILRNSGAEWPTTMILNTIHRWRLVLQKYSRKTNYLDLINYDRSRKSSEEKTSQVHINKILSRTFAVMFIGIIQVCSLSRIFFNLMRGKINRRYGNHLGRDGRIRTYDPLHPMQVRYQTALRPDVREVYNVLIRQQATDLF